MLVPGSSARNGIEGGTNTGAVAENVWSASVSGNERHAGTVTGAGASRSAKPRSLLAKGIEHLEQMFVELISENTGGPLKYTGKSDMKKVHAGMKITDSALDATLAVMEASLKKFKSPTRTPRNSSR